MRRLNPAVTLITALLTAASAAIPISGLARAQAQADGPAAVRQAPSAAEAPEAPAAITALDSMSAARAPRHLLRNGKDYLQYGEFTRALALFREAESRIGELPPAEQQELRAAIEAARQGLRTPSGTDAELANRRPSARSRASTMPGAIALAPPPLPDAGPMASTDGVVLTAGERTDPAPPAPPIAPEPIAPEPIAVTPSAAPVAPEPIDLPPIDSMAATASSAPADPIAPAPLPPADAPAPPMPIEPSAPPLLDLPAQEPALPLASTAPEPEPAPAAEPDGPAITLPPLPADAAASPPDWPSEAISALPADRLRNPDAIPAPPAELPALPPSADELMDLGSRIAEPIAPADPTPSPGDAPTSSLDAEAPRETADVRPGGAPVYRDLLSPEQREEIMMIVRRQQDAEQQGLMPAPLDDPGSLGYDREDLSSSSIQLPRPPSPTEIRPIQSIPVPDAYVPLPPRRFNPSRKFWAAAATCHGPLYFQDPVLERYGQSVEQKVGPVGRFLSYPLDDTTQSRQRNQIVQPLFSAALFATQIATWPYKAIVDPPGEAEYDLGYYRPGDLVPPDLIYVPHSGVGPPLQGKHY